MTTIAIVISLRLVDVNKIGLLDILLVSSVILYSAINIIEIIKRR